MDFTADVTGGLTELVIEQKFRNDSSSHIEAVYTFPLQPEAAVDGMWIKFDGREIRANVRGEAQARQAYDQAARSGQVAALTEQERPNLFTQHVANIPPGAEIEVELRVIQPVERRNGAWELVIPMAVAPRFVPEGAPNDVSPPVATSRKARDGVADTAIRSGGTGVRVGVDVNVHAGVPIRRSESPTHRAEFFADGESMGALLRNVPPTRDFILRWWTDTERPAAGMIVADRHALLTFEPPNTADFGDRVPREVIWVIDTSGSMRGAPLELAKQAMTAGIRGMDGMDSFAVLGFGNEVDALDAKPVDAHPENQMRGLRFVEHLQANGGTYMMKAVRRALAMEPDPARQRFLVFITDGAVSNDDELVRAIGEVGNGVTVVTIGIGAAPNRYLLDEMAGAGGGASTYVSLHEHAGDAVKRILKTMERPAMSQVAVDWGGWQTDEVWPNRIPDLFPGKPLQIIAKLPAGGGPVRVTGRVGEASWTEVIDPVVLERARAIETTWARQKIASIHRAYLRGDITDERGPITATALEYGIVSEYTSMVAVDPNRTNRTGTMVQSTQPNDIPDGMEDSAVSNDYVAFSLQADDGSEEIEVIARRAAVDVESTTRGTVLTKDYLQRIPAGRSYQSAVSMAPGVAGGGGNPNIAGGASNENTYMLDGANITDPVTGTFSVNFNFDAIQQLELLLGGRMAEFGGVGATLNAVSESGTNNLQFGVGAHGGLLGQGLDDGVDGDLAAKVSGPLVRDRLWLLADYQGRQTTLGNFGMTSHAMFNKVTTQPNAEHRFTASVLADPLVVTVNEDASSSYGGYLPQARWQVFLSPDVNLDFGANYQSHLAASRFRTDIASGHARLSAVSIPMAGTHDIKFGMGSRNGQVSSDLETFDLGVFHTFVQDSYQPVHNLRINGGMRLDVLTVGDVQALPGPRLFAAWDPFGDQKTKIVGGVARYQGVDLLVPGLSDVPREDEALALVSREIIEDVALSVAFTATRRIAPFAPSYVGFLTAEPEAISWLRRNASDIGVTLEKIWTRRWFASVSWNYSPLQSDVGEARLDNPLAPWVPGFLDTWHKHRVGAMASWDLPTDPWTQRIGGTFGYADAISSEAPQWWLQESWTAGVTLQQDLDVRKGRITLDLAGRAALNNLSIVPFPAEILILEDGAPTVGELPPLRVDAGMRYEF